MASLNKFKQTHPPPQCHTYLRPPTHTLHPVKIKALAEPDKWYNVAGNLMCFEQPALIYVLHNGIFPHFESVPFLRERKLLRGMLGPC